MSEVETGPAEVLSWRTLILGTFLPSLLVDIGYGAMLPVLIVSATRFGASLAVAGLLASLVPVGQILAGVPAGVLVGRVGDRRSMLFAGATAVVGFLACAVAGDTVSLAVAVAALGATMAVFGLARHSHLTEVTPADRRARVLSTLAGCTGSACSSARSRARRCCTCSACVPCTC